MDHASSKSHIGGARVARSELASGATAFGGRGWRQVCGLLAGLLLLPGLAGASDSLWVGTTSGALEVDPTVPEAVGEIQVDRSVEAIAVDRASDVVWLVTSGGTLRAFEVDGPQQIAIDLPGFVQLGAKHVAVDPVVGNVWAGRRGRLWLYGNDGSLRREIEAVCGAIRAMALDPARSRVWVATRSTLLLLDSDGALMREIAVPNVAIGGVRDIAWDPVEDHLWLIGRNRLQQYSPDGDVLDNVVADQNGLQLLAADGQGGAWVATNDALYLMEADGTAQLTLHPWGQGLLVPEASQDLVADVSDGSAWIASGQRVRRYDTAGTELGTVPADFDDQNRLIRALASFSDMQPPDVAATAPAAGAVITDVRSTLAFSLTDASGIDAESVEVRVNDQMHDAFGFDEGELIVDPPPAQPWPAGNLSLEISARDLIGNQAQAGFDYFVQPDTAAFPRAVPASGDAPLTVNFTPETTTGSAIELYEWDLTGDGSIDRSDTIGRSYDWTYNAPGEYEVLLRVTDSEGGQSESTVLIEVGNAPPEVSASANPSNGPLPLTVAFTADATDNEGVDTYEWDFQGDGSFEPPSSSASATHTYEETGTFQPALRVTDTLGESTTVAVPTIEVRVAPPGAPSVSLSASPASGTAPLSVSFTADAEVPGDGEIVGYAWDFDGDGETDLETDSPSASHTYEAAGTFFPRVRVSAADGQQAEDVAEINVASDFALSVSTDTIDPGLEETAVVETSLGGRTEVSIVIEGRDGQQVRTLVPWTVRDAGSYDDPWDGMDDSGQLVREGDYYAVLLYRIDGQQERLDLRESTGGEEDNPSRTQLPDEFSPFAGDPLEVDFTLDRAADVTAFIGRYSVNTRLVTFHQRQPMGRGTHRVVWNSTNDQGQYIEPPENDSFLFGIFEYALADNAIYVRTGAHLSGFSVEPSLLVPHPRNDSRTLIHSQLRFNLSAAATVRLTVQDMETGDVVARRQYAGLEAGEHEVAWDGTNDEGVAVAPGRYRLGLTATDAQGFQSTTVYALQRVYY